MGQVTARDLATAREVLRAYDLGDATLTPVTVGLINLTLSVEAHEGRRFILQRLNPVFTPKVHLDIDAVTRHIEAKGLETPRIVATAAGDLWIEQGGDAWRVLTFVDGEIHQRLGSVAHAREAGRLLGGFHRAIQDLDHDFQNRRLGVHDTRLHMSRLTGALSTHSDHRLFTRVEPIAREVLDRLSALGDWRDPPDRIVHGDPKVSNLVFSTSGEGRCLIDLDTLARMPITLELGDAFRSWCNASGEDASEVAFSLDLFEAALHGYADGTEGMLTDQERREIVPATERIILELSARFLTDALEERYFGWDPGRFPTRGEHNELRARGQLSLARSFAAARDRAQAIVRAAFGS